MGTVDTELIARELRDRGHIVGDVITVADNAGSFEFNVDGNLLSLEEARALLTEQS